MFAVIYIPDFALQAILRLEPELHRQPIALIDEELPKPVVWQLTEAARLAGVVEGLTSTQALARCKKIRIKPRSRAQENVATETLLQCAALFAPTVESTGPGICTLDLSRLPASGNAVWGQKIIDLLGSLELRAHVGVAPTPLLALHAARRGNPFLAVQDATAFVNDLKVEDLDPSPEALSVLRKWGIARVGDLLRLGKNELADRLGPEALELFSRAAASEIRPLQPVRPAETFVESIDFEQEIESLEPLIFVLNRFLDQLSRRLEWVGLVAQELQLTLRLASGKSYEHSFRVPAPTREKETLFRILHTHLESLKTDAAIIGLTLLARPSFQEQHQFGLFEASLRDPNRFYETIARLTSLLGSGHVGTPVPLPTHRPDAFELRRVEVQNTSLDLDSEQPPLKGLPLRRFRPPLPATVECEDHRPVALRAGSLSGRVKKASGPWRISGDWWDTQRWGQDEWEIQLQNGALYRLAEREGKWFIEGVFN